MEEAEVAIMAIPIRALLLQEAVVEEDPHGGQVHSPNQVIMQTALLEEQ